MGNPQLPDGLAVSEPLPEITHLADVIGFVKRQEGDKSADFPIVRRFPFGTGFARTSAETLAREAESCSDTPFQADRISSTPGYWS